jgi:hypothetical protein
MTLFMSLCLAGYKIMTEKQYKPGRPSIPDDEKNILATFSLKRWQVRRLKETKNKSKLIQYLLTKHFTSLP